MYNCINIDYSSCFFSMFINIFIKPNLTYQYILYAHDFTSDGIRTFF